MTARKLPPHALREPARVLIVDDHVAARDGVRAMLDATPGIRCVALAADADEALAAAERTRPDVAVLDPQLADGSGIALCMRLKTHWPRLAVVIYSDFGEDELSISATIAGADALVDQADPPAALPAAVLAAVAGEVRAPIATPAALEHAGARLEADDLPILGMLMHRTPPADIARTLGTDQTKLTARRWRMLARLTRRDERTGNRQRRRPWNRTVPPRPPRPAT
jgi:DNA-binding NarL/FixJ family response regulator